MSRYWIGIDPGTNTGVCIWDSKEKRIRTLLSTDIEDAMFSLDEFLRGIFFGGVVARIENPSARGGRRDKLEAYKAQGAGSVKRDYAIWTTFFERRNVPIQPMTPAQVHSFKYRILSLPKGTPEREFQQKFKEIFGIARSTVHSREAACMVVYQ